MINEKKLIEKLKKEISETYHEDCILALERAIEIVKEQPEVEDGIMYKDNRLCLIPDDVYKRQCEELDKYKEIGTVKGYKDAIKAYNDCYFEKQELEQELYKYKQLGEFAEVKSAVEKQKPRNQRKIIYIVIQKNGVKIAIMLYL